MAHRQHVVKQGECISSIAFKYGFFPDSIWNDAENSELKEKREDPNILFPGDVVQVRDKKVREESCATEKKHRFKRKGVPEILRLQFFVAGEARANEAYILEVDGKVLSSDNKTSSEGEIEHYISPKAALATVRFPDTDDKYTIKLGHLDPLDTISGVQGRLQDLGLYDGPIDGTFEEGLEIAVANFQMAMDLELTGELDDDTRNALKDAYGE